MLNFQLSEFLKFLQIINMSNELVVSLKSLCCAVEKSLPPEGI